MLFWPGGDQYLDTVPIVLPTLFGPVSNDLTLWKLYLAPLLRRWRLFEGSTHIFLGPCVFG